MIPQIYTDKCDEILKYCEKMSIPVINELSTTDWASEFLYMWDVRWNGASHRLSDNEALRIKKTRKPSLKSSGTYYVHPDVFLEQLKKVREEGNTTMKTADLLKAAEDAFKQKVVLSPDFKKMREEAQKSTFAQEMRKFEKLFSEKPICPSSSLFKPSIGIGSSLTYSGDYKIGDVVMVLEKKDKSWEDDGPGYTHNMERYANRLANVTCIRYRPDGRKQYVLDIAPTFYWLGTWLVGVPGQGVAGIKKDWDDAEKEFENTKQNKDDDEITIELPTIIPLKIQL